MVTENKKPVKALKNHTKNDFNSLTGQTGMEWDAVDYCFNLSEVPVPFCCRFVSTP
jgi:hypothetical protein